MHNFDWHAKMRKNNLFLILLLLHAKYAFCVHKCLIFSLIFHVYFNLNFTKILGYTCSRTFRSGAKLKAHENGWFVTSLLRLILTFHNPILIPRSVGPFVGSDSTKWYTRIGTSVSPFGMDKPSNHYCSHLNIPWVFAPRDFDTSSVGDFYLYGYGPTGAIVIKVKSFGITCRYG